MWWVKNTISDCLIKLKILSQIGDFSGCCKKSASCYLWLKKIIEMLHVPLFSHHPVCYITCLLNHGVKWVILLFKFLTLLCNPALSCKDCNEWGIIIYFEETQAHLLECEALLGKNEILTYIPCFIQSVYWCTLKSGYKCL